MAFGLVLVATLALIVAVQGSKSIDARELVESSFEVGALPFGLVLAEGARIATGETLVVFRAGDVDEPARLVAPEPEGGGDDEEPEPFDWTAIEEGAAGTPPVEVFLVWYPVQGGAAAIKRQFDEAAWQDLRDFEADGGRLMTAKDTLVWAGYDADYVMERELERGGTFRDWVRVNLSLPERACVLFARWARGKPASIEPVGELLRALRPLTIEAEGGDG